MKSIKTILLVVLALFILYVKFATVATPGNSTPALSAGPAIQSSTTDAGAIPPKALQVLQIVRSTGEPPEGYVGGRVFENREGRLPADGDYHEFDVDPHNGNRNAERIIVEWKTRKAWYTGDHYQTFLPLP